MNGFKNTQPPKFPKMTQTPNKYTAIFIHLGWLISIMIIAIIALVSSICQHHIINANKILTFISYFSTFLSIILSIFAIQYTYTSNNQIQQKFEKIDIAADNIKTAAHELTKTSDKLSDNIDTILTRLETIDKHQRAFSDQLQKNISPITASEIDNTGSSEA